MSETDANAERITSAGRDGGELRLLYEYGVCANRLVDKLNAVIALYETSAHSARINERKAEVKRDEMALNQLWRQLSSCRTRRIRPFGYESDVVNGTPNATPTGKHTEQQSSARVSVSTSLTPVHPFNACSTQTPQILVIPKTEPRDDDTDQTSSATRLDDAIESMAIDSKPQLQRLLTSPVQRFSTRDKRILSEIQAKKEPNSTSVCDTGNESKGDMSVFKFATDILAQSAYRSYLPLDHINELKNHEYYSDEYVISDVHAVVAVDNTEVDGNNDGTRVENLMPINLDMDSENESSAVNIIRDKRNLNSFCKNQILDLTPIDSTPKRTKKRKKTSAGDEDANQPKVLLCQWNGCSYHTSRKGDLVRHNRRHVEDKPHKCTVCAKRFTESGNLKQHLKVHNAGKRLASTSKIISNASKRANRTNSATAGRNRNPFGGRRPRNSGDLVCPVRDCPSRYFRIQRLWTHMRRNHGVRKAESIIKRFYLEKKNTNGGPIEMSVILNRLRDEQTSPKADKCVRNSPTKTPTKSPLKAETKSDDRVCDFVDCNARYLNRYNLKRHQQTVHKRLSKTLFASYVGRPGYRFFIPRSELKRCSSDGKSDGSSEKENLFVCNFADCRKSYSTSSSLSKHKRIKHLKKEMSSCRTYACDVPNCRSTFIFESNVVAHKKYKHNIIVDERAPKSHSDGALKIRKKTVNEVKAGASKSTPNPSKTTPKSVVSAERFDCPYERCAHSTSNKLSLLRHFNRHFKVGDKQYKCVIDGCRFASSVLAKLKNHVLDRHSEQQFLRAFEDSDYKFPIW